jgi:hypothetical protein
MRGPRVSHVAPPLIQIAERMGPELEPVWRSVAAERTAATAVESRHAFTLVNALNEELHALTSVLAGKRRFRLIGRRGISPKRAERHADRCDRLAQTLLPDESAELPPATTAVLAASWTCLAAAWRKLAAREPVDAGHEYTALARAGVTLLQAWRD